MKHQKYKCGKKVCSSSSSTSYVTVDCCESSSECCFNSTNDCTECCSTLSKSKSVSVSSSAASTVDSCFDKNTCRGRYKVVRVYKVYQSERPTELDYASNAAYTQFKTDASYDQFQYFCLGAAWLLENSDKDIEYVMARDKFAKYCAQHRAAITPADYESWKGKKSHTDACNFLTYKDWYDTMNKVISVKVPQIKGWKKTRSYITYRYLKKKGFGDAYNFKKFLVFYDWFHYAAQHDKDYRDTCAFASFCVAYDKCELKKRYCHWRKACKSYGDWFVFNLWFCCNRDLAEQFIWKDLTHNRYQCKWECNYYYKLVKKYWPKKYYCKYQKYVGWRQYAFANNIDPDNYVEYEFWACNIWDVLPPLPPTPPTIPPPLNVTNPCHPVPAIDCTYVDLRCIRYKDWRCCKTQCDFIFVIDFLCWLEDQKYYYKRAKKIFRHERCCHNGVPQTAPLEIKAPEL